MEDICLVLNIIHVRMLKKERKDKGSGSLDGLWAVKEAADSVNVTSRILRTPPPSGQPGHPAGPAQTRLSKTINQPEKCQNRAF